MALKSQILNIVAISLCCFFGGSALLFGITGGVRGLLFSPILAIFGWVYFILALVYVTAIWWIFNPNWEWVARGSFVAFGAIIGAVGMSVIGIFPIDNPVMWRIAYFISGGISSGFSAYLIAILKKTKRNGIAFTE